MTKTFQIFFTPLPQKIQSNNLRRKIFYLIPQNLYSQNNAPLPQKIIKMNIFRKSDSSHLPIPTLHRTCLGLALLCSDFTDQVLQSTCYSLLNLYMKLLCLIFTPTHVQDNMPEVMLKQAQNSLPFFN